MARSFCYLIVFPLTCLALGSWAQRSPYSLQTAVDELHHWDGAKFPLNAPPSQPNYYRSALGSSSDQDYWDDDYLSNIPYKTNNYRNRQRLTKELAKYLERDNYNNNNEQGGLSLGIAPFDDFFDKSNHFRSKQKQQKRGLTYFRQQDQGQGQGQGSDNGPSSVFRERDSQSANGNSELTQQFLREIEETQEHEREQRYKSALRHILDNYQPQQDNDVDNKLFDEQKRMRVPPYYMLMQKKRSYPVLPWLPYNNERKKRFPVTKRSTKRSSSIDNGNPDKTDDKVEQELSELFGISNTDAKQKRSTDEQINTKQGTGGTTTTTIDTTTPALSTALNDMRLEMPLKTQNNGTVSGAASNTTATAKATAEHHHVGHNSYHAHQHDHKHNKRSNHHSGEDEHESDEEEEEDSEEHGEHDEHEDEEDDEEFGDEEDEERKKKRDVSGAKQTVPGSDSIMKRRKKSIQWSKYFGIDRKKKAMQMDKKFIKRSASQDSVERDVNNNNLSSDKLKSMDKKLQSIEDMIIDETIKYTGAHEGITNPADIRRLKDHVLSRLATAYSLEKMRLALDKLRQSVDSENHLLRNVIESDPDAQYDSDLSEYANQLVKKEKSDVPDKNRQFDVLGDNDKKHKNKRTNYQRYPELTNNDLTDYQINRYGNLNDAYLGNKNYIAGSNQCPLIESMAERCRGIDILSGDLNQDLLPICGVHQICYLCGTSQISCDYQYLGEADAICGNNDACQAAARTILMILRGSPGPQLGPRECEKSSCLYSAMREIGL